MAPRRLVKVGSGESIKWSERAASGWRTWSSTTHTCPRKQDRDYCEQAEVQNLLEVAGPRRQDRRMGMCTAPVQGHRSPAARAACPAFGGGDRGYSYQQPRYSPSPRPAATPARPNSSIRSSTKSTRPIWSPENSPVSYTPKEVGDLAPVRKQAESRTQEYDVFLCHA